MVSLNWCILMMIVCEKEVSVLLLLLCAGGGRGRVRVVVVCERFQFLERELRYKIVRGQKEVRKREELVSDLCDFLINSTAGHDSLT